MRREPNFRKPPGPRDVRKKYIVFKYESGKETFSTNLETAQEIFEIFKNTPTLKKENAYFWVDNRVIFLRGVTEIIFNFDH